MLPTEWAYEGMGTFGAVSLALCLWAGMDSKARGAVGPWYKGHVRAQTHQGLLLLLLFPHPRCCSHPWGRWDESFWDESFLVMLLAVSISWH